MTVNKDSLIKYYKELNKNVSNISRDVFCSHYNISKHKITKLFGSFSEFKHQATIVSQNNNLSCSKPSLDNNPYIDLADKVKFNKSTSDYVFNFNDVKNIGDTIIVHKTQLYAMLQSYSDFDDSPKTLEEISLKFKMPIYVIKKIFQSLDMTHSSPPITEELINSEQDDTKIVEDLYAIRKSNIFNKLKEKTWQQTQADANKWNLFESGTLNPYRDILETWEYPKSVIPKINTKDLDKNSTYIVSMPDLHFGDISHKEYSFYCNDEDWTIQSTAKAIDKYIKSIKTNLESMRKKPNKCVLISLGDILHSISGFTDKGTELEVDTKGPLQFKVALDSITKLISFLSSEFPTIEINAVSGNHDSFADWVLFTALEKVFSNNKNIKFNISMCRWLGFMLGSNLFVVEHGYSPFYKSKVPKASSAKESYIHRLILKETNDQAKKGISIKNRYFMMGDLPFIKQES